MSVPGKNLLMLKLPRTGSTYLAHLLATHENIDFHHEFLNRFKDEKRRVRQGIGRIPGIRALLTAHLQTRKCEVLRTFLAGGSGDRYVGASLNPFKESFSADDIRRIINKQTRIIVLTRDNLLKQQISHLNVMAEKQSGTARPYKSYNADKRHVSRTFYIDEDALAAVEELAETRRQFLNMMEKLPGPKLYLTYEADINVDDKSQTFEKLANFLQLPVANMWRPGRKQSDRDQHFHKIVRDDLSEIIENYDQIRDHVLIRDFI